jgi:ribose/xylose/arabinose/galactoside ABC-type transport system permease subunit
MMKKSRSAAGGGPGKDTAVCAEPETGAWFIFIRNSYIYIVLFLIVMLFSVVTLDRVSFFGRGHFLSPVSVVNLLRSAVPIITVSSMFTFLMISGHIDLSVGSAMSLSAVVYALMVRSGFGFIPSFTLTLLAGVFCGFLNGGLVMKLRITPVIATLVTLSIFKGIALLIVPDGVSAIKSSAETVMPAWINDYARKAVLLNLPAAFYVAIVLVALLLLVQRRTLLGKYAAAIGGNRTAAELSGINTVRIGWIIYIMVGLFAALAGIARASYMSLGDPLSGDGMETDCIIAVLLGGTSFYGGEGSVVKTVIGALIIMCVTIGLMTIVPPYWQVFARGLVLIFAVTVNHMLARK